MQQLSLGARANLALAPLKAEIIRADRFIAVKTHDNPAFYWGNYIITRAKWIDFDIQQAKNLFEQAFEKDTVFHHAILFDDPIEEKILLSQSEFYNHPDMSVTNFLAFDAVSPTQKLSWEIRDIRADDAWAQVIELQTRTYNAADDAELSQVLVRRIQAARECVEKGHGSWIGAFSGEKLVGDLFLSIQSSEFACLDQVETAPEFRRQGVASDLVRVAIQIARQQAGIDWVLVEAEADGAGDETYRKLGFRQVERIASFEASPRKGEV